MKVSIGKFPNRWMSNIHTRYMNKKYGYVDWPEYKQKGLRVKAQPFAEAWREQAEDLMQTIYNCTINLFLDRRVQKIKVRIDKWDTWSMDHTLAHIVLPMLVQLKETKHGAPYVDPDDCPKDLRPKEQDEYGTDDTHFGSDDRDPADAGEQRGQHARCAPAVSRQHRVIVLRRTRGVCVRETRGCLEFIEDAFGFQSGRCGLRHVEHHHDPPLLRSGGHRDAHSTE